MAFLTGLEASRIVGRFSRSSVGSVMLVVWLGITAILAVLLVGPPPPRQPLNATYANPSDFMIPFGSSWVEVPWLAPAQTEPDPLPDTLRSEQLLTGTCLMLAAIPAFVTIGRARVVALVISAIAGVAAAAGALPGATPQTAWLWALAVGSCMAVNIRVVYSVERRSWTTRVRTLPR
jgi:hypothetical protein